MYIIAPSVNMNESDAEKRSKQREREELCTKYSLPAFLLPATSTSASRQRYENPDTGTIELQLHGGVEENENPELDTSKMDVVDDNGDTGSSESNINTGNQPGSTTSTCSHDISSWPTIVTDKMIEYYIVNKPCNGGDISKLKVDYTDRNRIYQRHLQDSNLYTTKANGVKERSELMIFSETTKSVCKLFSITTKLVTGFGDLRNITRILKEHECSIEHISAMRASKKRSMAFGRIDTELVKQTQKLQLLL
ncbi:hypothetical protein JTB14_028362 [Gonioctena quinquepunctata]|nr:hypothetical protein JTB14_028362 [Gonioctena quinquepunctata]